MIEVENLRKEYGSVVALGGVSFEVPDAHVVGFLGPNGAGKSTTIKILTSYITATSGKARLAGFDVDKDPIEVRRRVGYLPERAPLYLDMTVVDYLDYAARARELGPPRDRKRAIARVASLCTLFDVAGRRISQLSKGFRQRVGLAQALIHDPEILILDEPMSGLDPIQITEIRNVIRRLGESRTVLFSTHIIPDVEKVCDEVVIIDRGQLVAKGSPQELRLKSSEPLLRLRWRGAAKTAQSKVQTLINKNTRLQVQELANGIAELTFSGATLDDKDREALISSLSGEGRLLEMRDEIFSLEETFFKVLGRRSEDSAA